MRVDAVLRKAHLYTGLFLVPWLLIYGTSALILNHGQWIRETFDIKARTWDKRPDVEFVPPASFPEKPKEQAREILIHCEIDGPHRVAGKPTPAKLVVIRQSGGGAYRLTWRKKQNLIQVERQSFSFLGMIHSLHFRGGYSQPYLATTLWAIIIDLIGISLWVWVITGIYIWCKKRKKWYDWASIGAGLALFAWLAVTLCI